MRFRKHMFALSKAYDLGYKQGLYHEELKNPTKGKDDALPAPKIWHKRTFITESGKTTIFGPLTKKE